MKLILSIHPLLQLVAILLSLYAFYLGFQRARSLHFGKQVPFNRDRHVIVGSLALLTMLGGFAGGLIMVERILKDSLGHNPHATMAFIMLPLLVFALFSGFFLYLNPKKRLLLPAVHGINNILILALSLVQIVTGVHIYLQHVLGR